MTNHRQGSFWKALLWLVVVVVVDALSSASTTPKQQRIAIVGGGVGGLAIASRIAAQSYPNNNPDITIYEKNERVGGRCGSFSVDIPKYGTFRHEIGPSLLLLPQVYRDVFEDCETTARECGLHMEQCIPAYQVVFDDGDRIELGFLRRENQQISQAEEMSRQKMKEFEANGDQKWDEYMAACSAFLDCGLPNFIEERLDLPSFPAFLRESLRDGAKAWPLKPHSSVLDATFESEKMKALASFQDLYVGLEPYENQDRLFGGVLKSTAPAVFGLLAAIELHPSNKKAGVFAPIGGFETVSKALERLATKSGVNIECNCTITGVTDEGIHVSRNNNDSEFIEADLVVVNADLPYATKSLFDPNELNDDNFDWDDQFSYSSGVISFHWSVSKRLDDLNTHNVFMVAGNRQAAEASWKVLRDDNESSDNSDKSNPFNFYVHRASKVDPTASPEGCDSIMVLVPCQTLLRDQECCKLPREEAMKHYKEQFTEETISKVRNAVLERFQAVDSLQNLHEYIIDEVVDTPATWSDKFHLAAGTPFALSHGLAQLSYTRPGPRTMTGYDNVLFCGASSRPGNGVPLVLLGAKQVAEVAVKQLLSKKKAKVDG